MLPESLQMVVTCASAIVTISAAATVFMTMYRSAKKPNELQNQRLDKLEDRMKDLEDKLSSDNVRLNAIERGNRVTQRALLALLSHEIDGNHTEGLKSARDELQNYLLDRGVSTEYIRNAH